MSDTGLAFEFGGRARVLFTSRADGNLSSAGGDGAAAGARNRERLRELTGTRALVRGYQVHGTRVLLASDSPASGRPDEADGQATSSAGLGVMVLTADCMPVALVAPGAVAIVHAGWRGLAAGVLEEGVRTLNGLAPPGALAAVVGPCAGSCCYEVGPEVVAALTGGPPRDGLRTKIDLRALARERLSTAGVADVQDAQACTICDERFFSHRREGDRAGRQAGVAWLS